MSWFFYALSAAVLWGINYSVGERLIKSLGISSLLLANTIGGITFAIAYSASKGLIKPLVASASVKDLLFMILCAATSAGAVFAVQNAIGQKNATMAGLVEMAYPLFTAIFAFFLFGEMQLNARGFIGAAIVAAGLLVLSK